MSWSPDGRMLAYEEDGKIVLLDTEAGIPILLVRVAMGVGFAITGYGKLTNHEKIVGFFTGLGIPMPGLNAVVASWTELLCGTALVLGVMTRLAAFPLIITMIVAILTAKLKDLHGFFDLVSADEFTYIMVLLMIMILGPGGIAVDHVIAKRFGRDDKKAKA